MVALKIRRAYSNESWCLDSHTGTHKNKQSKLNFFVSFRDRSLKLFYSIHLVLGPLRVKPKTALMAIDEVDLKKKDSKSYSAEEFVRKLELMG